jgi:hypothetical protein
MIWFMYGFLEEGSEEKRLLSLYWITPKEIISNTYFHFSQYQQSNILDNYGLFDDCLLYSKTPLQASGFHASASPKKCLSAA